jgi:hypothetical protein
LAIFGKSIKEERKKKKEEEVSSNGARIAERKVDRVDGSRW